MSAPKTNKTDLGAGLNASKTKPAEEHPGGPVKFGAVGQSERAFSAASTFLSGVLAISASQFIGAPLKLIDPKFYDGYMAWTKESFAVLVATMTQWWAPTVVRVTGDESMKDQLYQMEDGTLKCNFPHRVVMMANHQLYTDWLYLWWIAYTNKMHGRIYIILKESIKNIPIIGWSAQFYNFIFLARKWETDKPRFRRSLKKLSDPKDPMWLLIFPEGTNLSKTTREKSKAWAEKQGVADMKHQLLPRSTGLQFCLQELKQTTNWLYDCTIAYEGVSPGQYGQDIFTLKSSFFEGRPPKSVNMYWRRFRISDIPVDNDDAFAMWLKNRWTEKDYLLEYFARHGSYPEKDPIKAVQTENALEKLANANSNGGKKKVVEPIVKTAKFITTEVKAGGMEEFMSIFAPITAAATAMSSGELSPDNIDFDALLNKVAQQQQLNLLATGAASKGTTNQDQMRQALIHATTALASGKPISGSIIEQVTGNAPQLQREMLKAMSKGPLPPHLASKTDRSQATEPTIQNRINSAHDETKQRLSRGGAETASNVRKSIPMAPMGSIVTRPLSTLAVQKATQKASQHMQRVAAARNSPASSSTPAAAAAAAPAKKQIPGKLPAEKKKHTPSKLPVEKKKNGTQAPPPKIGAAAATAAASKTSTKAPTAPPKLSSLSNGTASKAKK